MDEQESEAESFQAEIAEKQSLEGNLQHYAEIKELLDKLNSQYKEMTQGFDAQIKELRDMKDKVYEEKFKTQIEELKQFQDTAKENIENSWPEDEKSIKNNFGRFTMRNLQRVKIEDEEKLIQSLVDKGVISKAIKRLDNSYLKKVIDAEVIPKEVAHFTIKKSLAFTPKKND